MWSKFKVKRVAVVLAGAAVLVVAFILLIDPDTLEHAKKQTEVWRIVLYVVLANILTLLVGVALYWLWRWTRGGAG